MQWYYSKNLTQFGPVSMDELAAKLSTGEISRADLVWREGISDWQPVSSLPELTSLIPAQITSPPISGQYTSSSLQPPAIPGAILQTSQLSILSLVCGILGITCIPLIPSVVAIFCGHMALSEIEKNNPPLLKGKGLAISGLVTGYLGMFLTVITTLFLYFGFSKLLKEYEKDGTFDLQKIERSSPPF